MRTKLAAMNGLCGILDFAAPVPAGRLERLAASLAHRGAVSRDLFTEGGIGLAAVHTQQLGACGGADGKRLRILFDGELFDAAILRRELEEKGWAFPDRSDGCLLGAAYLEWGMDGLIRCDGRWALAIWDSERRSLALARDRLGEKPLYYQVGGSRLVFASELKAFLTLDDFSPAMDAEIARAVAEQGLAGEASSAATLLQGVSRILPGTAVTIGADGRVVQHNWWDIRAHLPAVPESYSDQTAQLRELLREALARRGDCDALLLSGGIGAAALAGLAGPMAAVTARFEGSETDWRHARSVAGHLGLDLSEHEVGAEDLARSAPRALWAAEIVAEGIAAPLDALFRAAAERGHRRLLCGLGANEVLMGHARQLDWLMGEANVRLFDQAMKRLPALLAAYENCAAAAGCELVLPYLDWRVLAYCLALPITAKAGAGHTQRILRDAVDGLVPDAVRLSRTKIGPESPADGAPALWHRLFAERAGLAQEWG